MLEPVLDDARDVQARSRQCLQRVRPDLEGDERDGGVLVFHPMARRTESGEELAAGGRDVSTLRGTSREVREASFRHVTPSREAELHGSVEFAADLKRDRLDGNCPAGGNSSTPEALTPRSPCSTRRVDGRGSCDPFPAPPDRSVRAAQPSQRAPSGSEPQSLLRRQVACQGRHTQFATRNRLRDETRRDHDPRRARIPAAGHMSRGRR
jgi:hypothetical protein